MKKLVSLLFISAFALIALPAAGAIQSIPTQGIAAAGVQPIILAAADAGKARPAAKPVAKAKEAKAKAKADKAKKAKKAKAKKPKAKAKAAVKK